MGRYYDTKEHKDWSKEVRSRGCAINDNCSPKLDAHHLIPKEVEKTRSHPMNGICLCARHHCKYGFRVLSPHNDAACLFFFWMMKNRPEQMKWVEENYDSS